MNEALLNKAKIEVIQAITEIEMTEDNRIEKVYDKFDCFKAAYMDLLEAEKMEVVFKYD